MHDPSLRKLLSVIAHASIFFSATVVSIGVPIALLLLSEDPVVRDNAREALNFHFAVWIAVAVSLPLVLLLIGIPMILLVLALSSVLPVIAIVGALVHPDEPFVYPVSVRLV